MIVILFTVFIFNYTYLGTLAFIAFYLTITLTITVFEKQKIILKKIKDITLEECFMYLKYSFYFNYTNLSIVLSAMYSTLGLALFIWIPYLLYKGHYILALVIIPTYFISKHMSVNLNPYFYLHDNLDFNRIPKTNKYYEQAIYEMGIIDCILEKIKK